jgi:hypothetical protein
MRKIEYLAASLSHKTNECMEWPFAKNSHGYGLIAIAGKTINVHQVAYMMSRDGWSLTPGNELCHECENRKCFNPEHLVERRRGRKGGRLGGRGRGKGKRNGQNTTR